MVGEMEERGMFQALNYAVGQAADRAVTALVPVIVPALALRALLNESVISVIILAVICVIAIEWGLSRRTEHIRAASSALKTQEESLDRQARDALQTSARAERIAGEARVETERVKATVEQLKEVLSRIDERTRVLDQLKDRILKGK